MHHADNVDLIKIFESELKNCMAIQDEYFLQTSNDLSSTTKKMVTEHVTASSMITKKFAELVSALKTNNLTVGMIDQFLLEVKGLSEKSNVTEDFTKRYQSIFKLLEDTKNIINPRPAPSVLKKIIYKPPRLNDPEKNQKIINLYAAWNSNIDQFYSLLAATHDREILDAVLDTAVLLNNFSKDVSVVKLAIEQGASIADREKFNTSYNVADLLGRVFSRSRFRSMNNTELQLLSILKQNGGDLHQEIVVKGTEGGRSLLMWAALNSNYTGASWLIAAGFDLATVDGWKESAFTQLQGLPTSKKLVDANENISNLFKTLMNLDSAQSPLYDKNALKEIVQDNIFMLGMRMRLMMDGTIKNPLEDNAWTTLLQLILLLPASRLSADFHEILYLQGVLLAEENSPYARLFFDKAHEVAIGVAFEQNLSRDLARPEEIRGIPNADKDLFSDISGIKLDALPLNLQDDKNLYLKFLNEAFQGVDFLEKSLDAVIKDNPSLAPSRVYYALGRMLLDTEQHHLNATTLEKIAYCFKNANNYRDAKFRFSQVSMNLSIRLNLSSSVFAQEMPRNIQNDTSPRPSNKK